MYDQLQDLRCSLHGHPADKLLVSCLEQQESRWPFCAHTWPGCPADKVLVCGVLEAAGNSLALSSLGVLVKSP